ncbi:uncharacterized protein [Triticum aestivum]|uniref:uncharacterized protein n=1 Tax=Triticum aestivum TaxID=4565 RepID=UPI001D0234E8|nr:uncharacterized protein LOC123045654 [Triticum aestivum]
MEVAGSMGAIVVTGCQELDEVHAGSTLSLNLTGGVAVQTTPVDGGAGESGKSMISMQINLLFWTGFDVAEHKGYTTVNHVIVYQTIKLMYDGAKELAQGESDYSKYAILPDNQLRNKLREAEPDPDDSQNQAPLLSLSGTYSSDGQQHFASNGCCPVKSKRLEKNYQK